MGSLTSRAGCLREREFSLRHNVSKSVSSAPVDNEPLVTRLYLSAPAVVSRIPRRKKKEKERKLVLNDHNNRGRRCVIIQADPKRPPSARRREIFLPLENEVASKNGRQFHAVVVKIRFILLSSSSPFFYDFCFSASSSRFIFNSVLFFSSLK